MYVLKILLGADGARGRRIRDGQSWYPGPRQVAVLTDGRDVRADALDGQYIALAQKSDPNGWKKGTCGVSSDTKKYCPLVRAFGCVS